MQSLWLDFTSALKQPEYVHILLNPLPVYGLAVGFLSLVAALATRSRGAQTLAVAIIFVSALAAWPVAHFGDAAFDRVRAMSDADAQKWLNWHAHLADWILVAFYTTAGVAALALVAQWRFPRVHRWTLPATAVLAAVTFALGGLLAYAGGKIRHAEFRSHAPPAWANTSPDDD